LLKAANNIIQFTPTIYNGLGCRERGKIQLFV